MFPVLRTKGGHEPQTRIPDSQFEIYGALLDGVPHVAQVRPYDDK
jgi:hypothetical protein